MKRVAFFDNKTGVGKTTLVYHLAHMLADLGRRPLIVDLDPQSNVTAMCVSEERLEQLWPDAVEHPLTIWGCVRPLVQRDGEIHAPHVEPIREGLGLLPGDLALSVFEDRLSEAWPRAMDRDEAAFRTLSAFHRAAELATEQHEADIVLLDVGPNLGAIDRAALLAADFLVNPIAPDLFSMQGLRNLGPALIDWRSGWIDRLARSPAPELLHAGHIEPLGYVVMQVGMRLSRPVRAYERWLTRVAGEYHRAVLSDSSEPPATDQDPWCLGIMHQYESLMPLAQDARKPMFHLRPADGAIGSHTAAVLRCREDFERLARTLLERIEAPTPARSPPAAP